MILHGLEIYISVIFYIFIKLFCFIHEKMYKNNNLTSIPERNEHEEEASQKWVPKKKHEVLKAKYKCLKKLFQIYDANVIGFLPDPNEDYTEEIKPKRRRKRSHRTKTDACAGTELTSDVTSECDQQTFIMTNQSETSHHIDIAQSTLEIISKTESKIGSNQSKIDFDIASEQKCDCRNKYPENIELIKNDIPRTHFENIKQHPIPYLVINERQKLTRFQCFIQRIFGIKREGYHENLYASSDCNARRQRGLRFRRLKRTKKNKSDSDIKDVKSPIILSYVQSVQKNCLMDKTARQCPIMGCHAISYGIINYNDHLNLSHLKNRKFICHYCHEGFEKEYDKLVHENDHIGINKVNTNLSNVSTGRQSSKVASITQTEPENGIQAEKLKKIVSFFDKIQNPEEILELKRNRGSESNIHSTTESDGADSDKRTVSCMNLRRTFGKSNCSNSSDVTSNMEFRGVNCRYCGENFNYRRQLSLHVDLEHRAHDKFSKFHSCAGIMSPLTPDGQINYQSKSNSCIHCLTEDSESIGKSETSLSCDQATNIVYYTSLESMKKPSVVESLVSKVRSYRWEPGTKIIRV